MRSSSHTHRRARQLRRSMTPPEALLWTLLRPRRPEAPTFRRQHPIGPYVADFYCASAKLVVEVDGGHHSEEGQAAHDEIRSAYLARLGYHVLRCQAADVLRDPEETADGIVARAQELCRR